MKPTKQHYELLARTVCLSRGDDPDKMEEIIGGSIPAWEFEAIDEDNDCVSTTRDTLDDFRSASPKWNESGKRQEINGGLYWEECQAEKGQRRCELCVVDCGDFRLIYQV